MAWWTAVPALLQLGGAVASTIGQYRQADLVKKYSDERIRRIRYQHEKTIGEAAARAGASGIEFESTSAQLHLSDMAKQYRAEADWLRNEAMMEAQALRTSALFSGFQGLGSSILMFGAMKGWGK